MSAQSKATRRFSVLIIGPCGLVIGYLLALFAVVAGLFAHLPPPRLQRVGAPQTERAPLSGEIDQLAHRRAGFEGGESFVDLVELQAAGDQMIELEPALAPQ